MQIEKICNNIIFIYVLRVGEYPDSRRYPKGFLHSKGALRLTRAGFLPGSTKPPKASDSGGAREPRGTGLPGDGRTDLARSGRLQSRPAFLAAWETGTGGDGLSCYFIGLDHTKNLLSEF